MLQSKRVKLNNALESVALDITGQHMMTTIYLGGPLEVNGTVYKNSSQDQTIQDAFRKEFVSKIRGIIKQGDYKDEKVFGAKVNFGSKIISEDVFRENTGASAQMSLVLLIILFVYLAFRTGSKFLSLVATSVILFSFRIILIVTRNVL